MQLTKPVMILGAVAFLSVSANVLMAGMLIGQKVSGREGGFIQRQEKFVSSEMNEADRQIVRQSMEQNKDRFKKTKKEMDAARQAVHAAMIAEPFDQQALETALETEMRQKAAFLAMIRDTRDKTLQQLSPEGREKMKEFHKSMRSFDPRGSRGDRSGAWRDRAREQVHDRADGDMPNARRFTSDGKEHPQTPPPDVDNDPPPPPDQP